MEKLLKRYIYILCISFIMLFISVMGSLMYLQERITDYTRECVETEATGLIAERLQERVENLIIRIDHHRNMLYDEVNDVIVLTADIISGTDGPCLENRIEICARNFHKMSFGGGMKIILSDRSNDRYILYMGEEQIKLTAAEEERYVNNIISKCRIKKTVHFGGINIYIFAQDNEIERIVEEHFHKQLHEVEYKENYYLWVKKLVDKHGGDRYAIDIINPNPNVKEGRYVSTSLEDAIGNKPYLQELEGIKKNGNASYVYYFPSTVDGEPVKKLGYGQYYEPMSWIVSCGVPLEKIDNIVASTTERYSEFVFSVMRIIVSITLLFFILIGGYNWWSGHKYSFGLRKYIEDETQRDVLTGAFSRRHGVELIQKEFAKVQQYDGEAIMLILDIDNFKRINDTYGHNVGDQVLKGFADTVMKSIREYDVFIRWGGEEFVLVCRNTGINNVEAISDKLLQAVRALRFDSEKGSFGITASIGAASLDKDDKDYLESLSRADEALYESKNSGKDKLTVFLKEADN